MSILERTSCLPRWVASSILSAVFAASVSLPVISEAGERSVIAMNDITSKNDALVVVLDPVQNCRYIGVQSSADYKPAGLFERLAENVSSFFGTPPDKDWTLIIQSRACESIPNTTDTGIGIVRLGALIHPIPAGSQLTMHY